WLLTRVPSSRVLVRREVSRMAARVRSEETHVRYCRAELVFFAAHLDHLRSSFHHILFPDLLLFLAQCYDEHNDAAKAVRQHGRRTGVPSFPLLGKKRLSNSVPNGKRE